MIMIVLRFILLAIPYIVPVSVMQKYNAASLEASQRLRLVPFIGPLRLSAYQYGHEWRRSPSRGSLAAP